MASNEGYVKHRRWKLESLGRLPLQTLNQLVRDNLSTDPSIRMWRRNTSKLKKLEDKVISWPTNCCRIFLGNKKEEVLERPGETSPAHAAVTRTTAQVLRAHHHQEIKKQMGHQARVFSPWPRHCKCKPVIELRCFISTMQERISEAYLHQW